ncbi:hypothetical protein JCM10908_007265 [Rhodotorula pacifica]|uniref:uncharacterized protein n=1 Tax=Rhodotorula pacifica TaxID=1495444 RepID=UPI003181538B
MQQTTPVSATSAEQGQEEDGQRVDRHTNDNDDAPATALLENSERTAKSALPMQQIDATLDATTEAAAATTAGGAGGTRSEMDTGGTAAASSLDAAHDTTMNKTSQPPASSATPDAASSPPSPATAPPPPRRRRRLPPPPPKGILRPPSSSHAATSRFSFRRDILQPFNSSYSRAGAATAPGLDTTATTPLVSERGAAAAAAVGEAVGNAAATAGGFFGNALKRLSAAAVVATAGAPATTTGAIPAAQGGVANASGTAQADARNPTAPLLNTLHAQPAAASASTTSLASTTTASSSSSSSSTLVPPASSSSASSVPPHPNPSSAAAPPAAPAPAPAQHPLPISSLKLVRFRMSSLKVVYPINNGTLEPIAPSEEGLTRERVEEEWRRAAGAGIQGDGEEGAERKGRGGAVEAGEREERGAPSTSSSTNSRVYTGEELARVYAEACRTREEPGIERLKRFFRDNPKPLPKVLDLSNELLSFGAVAALSDILAIDWGCKKLVLDNCGLDDEALKPLLHSLLVSASIPTVSLAGNKRIRNKGWRYLAVFLRKATFLRYLDLSETSIDRKAAEWLVQAVAPQPVAPPSTQTDTETASGATASGGTKAENTPKRVKGPWEEEDDSDEEGEGTQAEERNEVQEVEKEKAEIEDEEEEETEPTGPPKAPLFGTAPLLKEDWSGEGAAVQSLRLENCGLRGAGLEVLANGLRVSEIKHVSLRKNRINHAGGPFLAIIMRDYPLSTEAPSTALSTSALNSPALSSPTIFRNGFSNGTAAGSTNGPTTQSDPPASEGRNSVTAHRRHLFQPLENGLPLLHAGGKHGPLPRTEAKENGTEQQRGDGGQSPVPSDREMWRMSEARSRLRKQIDALPRFGNLLTLDVKGNDLRHGVTYVAQVLKRNRTLKTLNLSENKIDSHGLTAIAEALKYNTTLETLDMSHNPCCGPGVEGILALRSALMVSHSLKRIFLNSTELTSEGAIALAEFLPESRSVLHLDLTNNHIDISGVLALSVSIKLNSTIRCLDLNIPPNDPDFSRLSQDILNTCVRNTELAQEKADAEARRAADGSKRVVVAQPIRKSALASTLEERQRAEQRREQRRQENLRSQQDIFAAAAETRDVVRELLSVDEGVAAKGVLVRPSEVVRDALVQLQLAEAQLAEAAPTARQGEERDRAEALLSELASLLDLAKSLYDRPAVSPPSLPAKSLSVPATTPATDAAPPSPTFSLVDSLDGEEEDNGKQAGPASLEGIESKRDARKPDSLALPADSDLLTVPDPNALSARSPIESESRAMVAEESEVFRRGLALGVDDVPDEDDEEDGESSATDEDGQAKKKSEVSGEELKKEILETPVQRSPRTSFSNELEAPSAPTRTHHRRSSSSSSVAVEI